MGSLRQTSDNGIYKPPSLPAVWHVKSAWLCLTNMTQPFTDKLIQPVPSPGRPESSSNIRLDVTNSSAQVIQVDGKLPWLNINKGAMCETHVTF